MGAAFGNALPERRCASGVGNSPVFQGERASLSLGVTYPRCRNDKIARIKSLGGNDGGRKTKKSYEGGKQEEGAKRAGPT